MFILINHRAELIQINCDSLHSLLIVVSKKVILAEGFLQSSSLVTAVLLAEDALGKYKLLPGECANYVTPVD